ncbi:tail fiber domain-containing protein [Ciceribacter sp. L1K22]|uniref:tail fiber domain-containing protein n=1 Tax=Ciceribacter sp. L1K22 TaxID=2820275 RepID=UPI001ABE95E2|nr:tail fiber domain-containing protein [Ciceribacter sp. L1K22]MBO3760351.1 tail fiber domain-containing protein [Ciceribacter sp. L1K22]
MQAKTGEQWLSFARDAFKITQSRQNDLDKLTTRVTEQQLGLAREQAGWARADRQRYNETFRPLENKYIQEATNYDSVARQRQAASEARADVRTAAASARDTSLREAASYGISPASGRFKGVDASVRMNTTLAEAGAANKARQDLRDRGLALRADVVNMGRGLPAQAAGGAAGSVAASGTALSGAQATNAQALAAPGIMSSGFQGAMAGYQGMGSTLNQQYGLQVDAWRTQQQMAAQGAAGMGSFLGGVLGLFAPSSPDYKENKTPIEDGAAIAAVNEMPVEEWDYKPGIADGGHHVGPYADDFARATGKGDGKMINMQDAIGITMKAVQDVDKKIERIAEAVGIGAGRRPARRRNAEPMMREAA